jgi:hypothetical protein
MMSFQIQTTYTITDDYGNTINPLDKDNEGGLLLKKAWISLSEYGGFGLRVFIETHKLFVSGRLDLIPKGLLRQHSPQNKSALNEKQYFFYKNQ